MEVKVMKANHTAASSTISGRVKALFSRSISLGLDLVGAWRGEDYCHIVPIN
jgi:hypothetical protein